jgi:5-(carboxyamino)imidazole ribonucleotide synthase
MEVPTIIGFIGDGQLARMSAHKAIELGFECHFFGKDSYGPCKDLGTFFEGELNEEQKLMNFFNSCDLITLENEFIDSELLLKLQTETNTKIYPSAQCFLKIENKYIEKETFKNANIQVCEYALIRNENDLDVFMQGKSYPVMMKAAKGGYDGFGNFVANNRQKALEALNKFRRVESDMVIAEEMVPFIKEVAVTVARSIKGEIKVYPVVDTIQENNICHYVSAPANITDEISDKIKTSATKAMEAMDAVGIFSFEFFILENGDVLLNESAPRPHNSAHYSMDGCLTSQFENHIRAITGLKLGDVDLKYPKSVMVNLLGTDNRAAKVEQIDEYIKNENVHLHMYGKEQSRVGRKMGHVNITGSDSNLLLKTAKEISQKVRI